jgi:hypothetical protein
MLPCLHAKWHGLKRSSLNVLEMFFVMTRYTCLYFLSSRCTSNLELASLQGSQNWTHAELTAPPSNALDVFDCPVFDRM